MATEKRQRQDLGRQARLETEQKQQAVDKRKAQTRKYGIGAAVIVAVIGILLWVNRNDDSNKTDLTVSPTTIAGPSTTATNGASTTVAAGGSTTTAAGGSTSIAGSTTAAAGQSTSLAAVSSTVLVPTPQSPIATIQPAPMSKTTDLTKKPVIAITGDAPPILGVTDLVPGAGPEAKPGDKLSMQYVGVAFSTKKEFDASWNRGQPFEFTLGTGKVIQGWDQGLVGMKVGGRRQLVIPPGLGYGPAGSPPVVGPNETLVFVVDLVSVNGQTR